MSADLSATGPAPQASRLHASCALVGRTAVLLRGPPGSGKSALLLELLANAAPDRLVRLVADDAVELEVAGARLIASAPPRTFGMLEVRGVGLIKVEAEPRAVVRLVVDLVSDRAPERLPEALEARAELFDITLPRLVLPSGGSGNVRHILMALAALDADEDLPVIPSAPEY